MSILCALHIPRKGTWIGADSRVTGGLAIYPMPMRKIVRVGGRALLISGNGAMVTLANRHRTRLLAKDDPDAVAMALVALQSRENFRPEADGAGPLSFKQAFIYATPRGVWDIDVSGSWLSVEAGTLWARGSGSDYALGYDFALRQRNTPPPRDRIHDALHAAAMYDAGCGEPFVIEHLV